MDLKLKGKRALVTGGTRGMGRAIAETLAGEGCNLSICARKQTEVAATAESLHEVVAETVRSNPNVLIARNQRNAVEQEMEQARAGFFPSADITVGEGWESSNNPTTRATGHGRRSLNRTEMEITARQLLFDGFGTESEFDRQKARVNSRAYSTFGTSEVTGNQELPKVLYIVPWQKSEAGELVGVPVPAGDEGVG